MLHPGKYWNILNFEATFYIISSDSVPLDLHQFGIWIQVEEIKCSVIQLLVDFLAIT